MVKGFSIVAVAAIAAQALTLIALHLVPTGYHPRVDL